MNKKNIALILSATISLTCSAQQLATDKVIENIYQSLPYNISLDKKISLISAEFIGHPYILGALGEGIKGSYDQSPLYRTDGFDCTTYVSTVLGIGIASNVKDFKKRIINIQYKNNRARYLDRNHFISLDWNKNNIRKGYIQDITPNIINSMNKPIFEIAQTNINKKGWLQHKTIDDIKIANKLVRKNRLNNLYRNANKYPIQTTTTKYLPLAKMYNEKGKPDSFIFKQIPNGSILEIVRPNWNLKNKIGTNLNISHMGFALRKNNKLYFRHASDSAKKIVDSPLAIYLSQFINSPTVKGIAIFMPQKTTF